MSCSAPGSRSRSPENTDLELRRPGGPRGLPRKGAAPPGRPLPNRKGWENKELTAVLLEVCGLPLKLLSALNLVF